MNDPLFEMGPDDMSRAFDASNADVPPAGPPIHPFSTGLGSRVSPAVSSSSTDSTHHSRRSGSQHTVCPFCGTLNEDSAHSCRQCSMENTHATRQATRSKIGPWFVWQQRNPSAPGMNWSTLMSLVEKGRITPRSVVRGPTTGQLWRFAARVKGLSREFSTCWHCGSDVVRSARLCTACKRLQQPPLNPDSLLETDPPAPAAIRGPLPAARPRGAGAAPVDPVRREVPQPRDVAATVAENMRAADIRASDIRSIDTAPMTMNMDDSAELPSGLELRTFQLDDDAPHHDPPRKGLLRRMLVAAVFAGLVLAVTPYFTPQGRPHYVKAYEQVLGWIGSAKNHPANGQPEQREPAKVASYKATPLLTTSRPPASTVAPAQTQAPAMPTDVRIGPGATTPESPAKIDTTEVTVAPGGNDPKNAELRAWQLRERAINSERRADYDNAVKEYEWIEQLRLPEGVGPTDIDSRLQHARELLKAQAQNN